jgi:hypothetical protein
MSEVAIGPSAAMLEAIGELWRLRPPGPENILAHPAFAHLREECRDDQSGAGTIGFGIALSTALRTLGLPCSLPEGMGHLAVRPEVAADMLIEALRATHARRLHLAPLDLASELPELAFGSARVSRLTAEELRALVDAPRLKRFYPREEFDAERFAEFHWLIVEETVPLSDEPGTRAVPVFGMDLRQDLGRIEPHKGRFPRALEETLFFLLLAPWEGWSTMLEVDWRGFRVPWVYTVDSDLFVRPNALPSPDTLSWEDRIHDDGYGVTYEEQRPLELTLEETAATELAFLNQSRWQILEQAKQSVLFETPRRSPIFLSGRSWPKAWMNSWRISRRSRRHSACSPIIRRAFVSRLIATRECAPRIECEGGSPGCSAIVAMLTSMRSFSIQEALSCMAVP